MAHRRGLDFATTAALLILLAAAVLACLAPAQSDTFWQLQAGSDIWGTRRVPLSDTYSHTITGLPWPNHSWLWQAGANGLWKLGGFPLLSAVNAAMLLAALILSFTLLPGDPVRRLLPLALAFPVMASQWGLRPQGASMLMLAVLLHLLVGQWYWGIPPLMLLWANLHGAVALGGFVLVVATGAQFARWLLHRDPTQRRQFSAMAAVTAVSAAATLLTPMGTGLWSYVWTSIGRSKSNEIDEWASAFHWGLLEAMFWVWAAGLVALCTLRWRRAPGPAERLVIVIALALLPLAASSVRNVAPFVIAALPAVIALVGRSPVRAERQEHPRLNAGLVGSFAAAGIATVAVAWSMPLPSLSWEPVTPAAAQAIGDCPGPLYNRYDDGGYIIWFAPQTPVFVDNRQDPYPQDFLEEHFRTEKAGDYRAVFERYGIGCAVLPPYSPTAAALQSDGWEVAFDDGTWVVFHPPAESGLPG